MQVNKYQGTQWSSAIGGHAAPTSHEPAPKAEETRRTEMVKISMRKDNKGRFILAVYLLESDALQHHKFRITDVTDTGMVMLALRPFGDGAKVEGWKSGQSYVSEYRKKEGGVTTTVGSKVSITIPENMARPLNTKQDFLRAEMNKKTEMVINTASSVATIQLPEHFMKGYEGKIISGRPFIEKVRKIKTPKEKKIKKSESGKIDLSAVDTAVNALVGDYSLQIITLSKNSDHEGLVRVAERVQLIRELGEKIKDVLR